MDAREDQRKYLGRFGVSGIVTKLPFLFIDIVHGQLNKRIFSVSENDPFITEFELLPLEGEHATEDQITSLLLGLRQNTHVQKLDLTWTRDELRRIICRQLLSSLLQENHTILYLHFPIHTTNADLLPAADVLCDNSTTVKSLGLAGCDIRGGEGGEIVALLIRNNHCITAIMLSGNFNLGPAGATCIAAALFHDDCALKTLFLDECRIGNEGMTTLCTALQTNNSLEVVHVDGNNEITEEGHRALAKSLPHIRGLKEIQFEVSAAVFEEMMEGLHKNHSLRFISYRIAPSCSNEQRSRWKTRCGFVCARNIMKSHLDEVGGRTFVAAREGRVLVAPKTPVSMDHLLWWCWKC